MVVVLVGLASLFQYSYMGPTAGTLQNMLSPRMRATGTAFTSMIYTMCGGIGPGVLGVLSGHYVSRGINTGVALGLAMASLSLLYLSSAGHYLRASRTIEADFIRPFTAEAFEGT